MVIPRVRPLAPALAIHLRVGVAHGCSRLLPWGSMLLLLLLRVCKVGTIARLWINTCIGVGPCLGLIPVLLLILLPVWILSIVLLVLRL